MKLARIGVLAALGGAAVLAGLAGDGKLGSRTAVAAEATQPATVDNFMLVDQNLESHELYRMARAPAIVLSTQMNGCPISRSQAPAYKELEQAFAAKGVRFLMLNSAQQDSMEAIQKEAKDAGYDMPILMDSNQLVGESLGVKRTAEVFVLNPKTWQVVYHGPINDASDYGVNKAATKAFADEAVQAFLEGKPVSAATQESKGCLVDFPERSKKQAAITYVKDVAPILEKKCVACH